MLPRGLLVVLISLLACVSLPAQETASRSAVQAPEAPAWAIELQQRQIQLIRSNGSGTDAELREKLLVMAAEDQDARGFRNGQPKDKDKLVVAANLGEIDARLTAELKEIVSTHGWPTVALVGMEASNGAMLMLTHSPDHAWQLSLLPELEKLAGAGKIDGSGLALVVDKELVSEGKLQRYGTQFKFAEGAMAMYAVEDPAGLDARRARALLPPMDAYKQMLAETYHLKVTETVTATPPAKASEAKQP